jgi:23S rRNA pseudouridine1911/1915/1917 synthase
MTSTAEHHEFQVDSAHHKMRLDKYLSEFLEFDITRSQWKKLIEDGQVLLQGRQPKPSDKIKGGDHLKITLEPPREMELEPEDIPLDVLYEDEHLLVINKTAPMVVHPAPGHDSGTLVHAILFHCEDLSGVGGVKRPGIVHRLDRYTTGALVVAKHDQAHRGLAYLFKHRPEGQIDRRYLALASGRFREDHERIETWYGRHPKHRQRYSSKVSDGKKAITDYWVKERFEHVTLLELKLETGRTHQIRVHLADRHRSLVGDPVYGGKAPSHWPNRLRQFPRQALHAVKLAFVHPVTEEWIECEAPLPDDLETLLKNLHRWESTRS